MVYLPNVWRDTDRSAGPVFGAWHPLLRQIDELFNEAVSPSSQTASVGGGTISPTFHLEEGNDHYLLTADVPGVSRDDLNIELKDNHLLISGERRAQQGPNSGASKAKTIGRFQKSIGLPEGVKAEDVEAQYRDGVLNIAVKKPAQAKATKISIGEGKGGGFLKTVLSTAKTETAKLGS